MLGKEVGGFAVERVEDVRARCRYDLDGQRFDEFATCRAYLRCAGSRIDRDLGNGRLTGQMAVAEGPRPYHEPPCGSGQGRGDREGLRVEPRPNVARLRLDDLTNLADGVVERRVGELAVERVGRRLRRGTGRRRDAATIQRPHGRARSFPTDMSSEDLCVCGTMSEERRRSLAPLVVVI